MASDLMAAMLAGNSGASALAADPAMASVIPQLTLAQAMTQQGLSGAPAYPMQAIGRLAQALVGGKMMDDAAGEIGNAYGGAIEAAKGIYKEGTYLGDMLRSNNRYLQMMALQQVPKAALVNSEVGKYGPDQRGVVPSTARGGGDTVATGSPELAGKVAQQKSPYESGGDGTITGESGYPEKVPITAAERAELARRRANPGGAPPPAKPPVVVKPSGVKPAPGFFSSDFGSIPSPSGASAPAPKPAPAETSGPGAFDTRWGDRVAGPTHVGGIPFGPQYEGDVALRKELGEDYAKNSTKHYEAAQNLMGRLDVMDHNIEALGPRWMGAGANAKGEFGKAWNSMLDSAGVKGFHIDPNKIATWEEFNKESKRAGMELINANFGGSREAASIIQMGTEAVPSAQQTYLGAKYNAASIRAAAQREIDLHEFKADRLAKGQSLVGADVAFNREHPPGQYAMRGIVSVIPKSAIDHLAANPALAPQFDERFGAGTARFVLGGR